MDDATIVGLAGVVVAALAYFAGVQRGKHHIESQAAHARELQDKDHALQRELAASQRRQQDIDRVVATYVRTVRNHLSSGIYAVADSGIATLANHDDAVEALRRMHLEEGHDPLRGHWDTLNGVNLVTFFRYVRENGVNFSQTGVDTVLKQIRSKGIDPTIPHGAS